MSEEVACWKCDELIIVDTLPTTRQYCKKCEETIKQELKTKTDIYNSLKAELMLERAIATLEKQNIDIYSYFNEFQLIKELIEENPSKFDSAPEMLAAMELVRNRIKSKTQYKILNKRVDFYIESLKVVLEVDGHLHENMKLQDSKRDIDILNELGPGWEIVRIPTEYIENNLKQLVPAIKGMRDYKQKLRKENGGILPVGFSKRDNALLKNMGLAKGNFSIN